MHGIVHNLTPVFVEAVVRLHGVSGNLSMVTCNICTSKMRVLPVGSPAASRPARASQTWQIRVSTAKLRRLLKLTVPVVKLVMQVIDETNNAGTLFRRTSRLLVPIYANAAGNTAGVKNGGGAKWAADERG
jgi:hypothetical protein